VLLSTLMPNIVVVGAGPAGCTAALGAALLPGTHVKVVEKRSLESLVNVASAPRAYPMVLSGRALNAFDQLGLDLPCTRQRYNGITFVPSSQQMSFSGAFCICILFAQPHLGQ
jgi:2-polyprenyl-6-methoxyphenol hydroxylase-like FAD-dependent oxidoreductase